MKKILTLLYIFLTILSTQAQTYYIPSDLPDLTAHVTGGTLTDISGSSTMAPNNSGVLLLVPQVAGNFIKLTFTNFSMGPNDQLTIRNGRTNYSPLIGVFTGKNIPSVIYSSKTGGALYLYFTNQSSFLYQGFSANIQCIATLPLADLAFTKYQNWINPAPVAAGSITESRANVVNAGVKGARFKAVTYLSNDTIFNPWDIPLHYLDFFDTLYGGDEVSRTREAVIPATTIPGKYYILTVIDPSNKVPESNEMNNVANVPITIITAKNDLVFWGNSLPVSGRPGADIYLSTPLINYGNCTLTTAETGVYISQDNIFDSSDSLIALLNTRPLLSPPSYPGIDPSCRIPTKIRPGNYTLFIKADPRNLIHETNETNNVFSIPLNVGEPKYDIKLSGTNVLPVWYVKGSYSVNCGLTTTDIPADTKVPTKFFLSADSIIDAGDILLGLDTAKYYYYSGFTTNVSGDVPNIAPGNYFVLAYTDYDHVIGEMDETNNEVISTVQIKPFELDLQPTNPNTNKPDLAIGAQIPFYMYVYNHKGSNCTSALMSYYLSSDTIQDASDLLIGTKTVDLIRGNSYSYLYDTLIIPSAAHSGACYILYVVDADHMFTETNENNNLIYERTTIGPAYTDLTPSTSSFYYNMPDTLQKGVPLIFYAGINNKGNWPSDSTTADILLSRDSLPDPSDIVIATQRIRPVAEHTGLSFNMTAKLSNLIPDGDYYLINYVDHRYTTPESNETNNYFACKKIIGAGSGTVFNLSPAAHDIHTTCGEVIYDSGGKGVYGNNESGSLTLYPGITGNYIALDIKEMRLDSCCDHLSVYDGPSFSDKLIGSFSTTPTRIVSTHSTGALTLRFNSNSTGVNSGFKAVATCLPASTVDLSAASPYSGVPSFIQYEPGNIYYNLKNNGTRTAAATFAGIYLSYDSILDPEDIYIKGDLSTFVLAGTTSYNSTKILIPANVSPGNYYMIIRLDDTNVLPETNENNNVAYQQIILHPSVIDMAPFNLSGYIPGSYYYYTAPIYPGAQIEATVNSINIGYKRVDTSTVSFYFSRDTIIDAGDLLLGNSNLGSPVPTYYFHHSAVYTIPDSLPPGDYFLLARVDVLNIYAETNETNNTAHYAIKLQAPTMDLSTESGRLSMYTIIPGGATSLTLVVQDKGIKKFADTVSCGYYFSRDSIIDASDISLGTSTLIYPYYSITNKMLTIPASATPGNYFVIVKIDTADLCSESNELNNYFYFRIGIHADIPDATIQALAVANPPVFTSGAVSYIYNLKNLGYGNALGISLSTYLSRDKILDVGDTLLKTSVSSIPANSGSSQNQYQTLPPGLNGSYYLILVLDQPNSIAEVSETNNIAYLPLDIQNKVTDLTFASYSCAMAGVSDGVTTVATSALKLTGNTSVGSTVTGCYLSTDTVYDASDIFLNSVTVPSTYPYYYPSPVKMNITIPSGTRMGNYSLLFYADNGHVITEPDEDNNIKNYPLQIVAPTRDLKLNYLNFGATAVATGGVLAVEAYIYNAGSIATSSYHTGYYLSADLTYGPEDLLLESHVMNPLNPGAIDSTILNISIPSWLAAGDYNIIAYADQLNTESENNEYNNYFAQRITLVPGFHDLELTGIWGGISSSGVSVNYTTLNKSNLSDYYIKTAVYFSTDTIIDASDVLLSIQVNPSLDPGQQRNGYGTYSLPPGVPHGTYYIIAYSDYLNEISESNEMNNTRYTILNYNAINNTPIIDLGLYQLYAPDSLDRNKNTVIYSPVEDYYSASPTSAVAFYLSDNWLLDDADLLLAVVDSGLMQPYMHKNITANIVVPSYITPGIYYLISEVDYKNVVIENNENNNSIVQAVYVSTVTGIAEHAEDFKLIVFPNPSNGNISFRGHFEKDDWGDQLKIEVFNTTGELVYTDHFRNDINIEKHISLNDAANGVYFLKITGNQNVCSGKYVKVD